MQTPYPQQQQPLYGDAHCAPACPPARKRGASSSCFDINLISPVAVITEFIGTLWLVLVTGAALAMYSYGPSDGVGGVVGAALAAGLAVAAVVRGIGWTSGGYFNPALTLAGLIVRRLTVLQSIFYWIAQFAGALAAGGLLRAFVYAFDATLGTPVPTVGLDDGRAFGLEIVAMFFLTLFVLVSAKWGRLNAVVYGASVAATSLFLVPLTGASMNPARQLGCAVASLTWTSAWLYYVAPFAGAAAAALLYLLYAEAVQERQHSKKHHGGSKDKAFI